VDALVQNITQVDPQKRQILNVRFFKADMRGPEFLQRKLIDRPHFADRKSLL